MVFAMLQILTKQNIKTMSHLLEIKNLDVKFDTDEGRITAIDNVSLKLDQGKVLGIVGESGSGKSVTAKSIMHYRLSCNRLCLLYTSDAADE